MTQSSRQRDRKRYNIGWSCARKVSYPNEGLAFRAAIALATKYGHPMTRYFCPHCGAYHVAKEKTDG